MLTTAQCKRAGDIDVCGVLHPMTFPATPIKEHAFTGGAVRAATAGRGQAGVVVGGFLVEAELEFPVVGQCLFQGGEVGGAVEIPTAPVGTRVETAREVGTAAIGKYTALPVQELPRGVALDLSTPKVSRVSSLRSASRMP
jgi:hypothetical protein